MHRFEDAVRVLRPNDDSVHHRLDVVHLVAVDLVPGFEFDKLAVDPGPEVSQPHDLFKQLSVVAFSTTNHGREEKEFLAFKSGEYVRGNLVVGETHHGFPRFQRKRIRGPGVKQPQKVVKFCDGADGRPRILRHGLLLDGHNRAEAGDGFDVRAFQSTKELPSVSTQCLQKPSLTFGVQRVKGKARLAAAADPREHHELIAWQHNIDVLEVVL